MQHFFNGGTSLQVKCRRWRMFAINLCCKTSYIFFDLVTGNWQGHFYLEVEKWPAKTSWVTSQNTVRLKWVTFKRGSIWVESSGADKLKHLFLYLNLNKYNNAIESDQDLYCNINLSFLLPLNIVPMSFNLFDPSDPLDPPFIPFDLFFFSKMSSLNFTHLR